MSEPKWIVIRFGWATNYGSDSPLSRTVVHTGKTYQEVLNKAKELNLPAEKLNETAPRGKIYTYVGTCE